jgi:nucleoside-diphosphate-sugar epimerase
MKAILVTGGNKGIGYAICERLLRDRDDTHVLLGSRSKSRGDQAREQLVASTPAWASRVEVLTIDTSKDESVASAASDVAQRFGTLYGVVNNAGVADASPREIVDVNLYGVKRVSDAFAPILHRPGGRLVHISSGSGPMFVADLEDQMRVEFFKRGNCSWEELHAAAQAFLADVDARNLAWAGVKPLGSEADIRYAAYGFSKAALNVLVRQHSRTWPDLVCTACSPGFIVTDLTVAIMGARGSTPEAAGALPPEKGTIAVWKLLFDTNGVISGRYYGSDGLRSPVDKYRSPGTPEYDQEF